METVPPICWRSFLWKMPASVTAVSRATTPVVRSAFQAAAPSPSGSACSWNPSR